MKCLITGGAGFIGSHIAESLLALGHSVIIYDNFSSGTRDNIRTIADRCEIVDGDILDFPKLLHAMANCDVVSHQAAQLEIFKSTDDPAYDLAVNTVGTLNVLGAARECRVRKIINASSACIYGQVSGRTAEDHYPRPNWAYGVSKLAAEKYCDIYSDYRGLPVVNLRYAITYGEREWYRRVLTIFVKRAVQGLPLVIFGDGLQIRDFIYVGDLVNLHNACMTRDIANGRAYNVGSGTPTTIVELAQAIVKASGKELQIVHEDVPEGAYSKLVPEKRRNADELKTMLLDISRATKDLGWKPTTSLVEGLRREMDWVTKSPGRWDKILTVPQPSKKVAW